MNTMAWIILLVVAFNLGFLFGCVWVSISVTNKKWDEVETEPHDFIKAIKSSSHPFMDVCHRCGKKFDLTTSPDPALDVCPECWEELKANPDDEYFKQEIYK